MRVHAGSELPGARHPLKLVWSSADLLHMAGIEAAQPGGYRALALLADLIAPQSRLPSDFGRPPFTLCGLQTFFDAWCSFRYNGPTAWEGEASSTRRMAGDR